MGTGVTVRHTQRIGEILMNKKLAASIAFVLIILGATMTISSHEINANNQNELITVHSLALPELPQKENISKVVVKPTVKEEQPLLSVEQTSKPDHVFIVKEEQKESKSATVSQPLTMTPTSGTGVQSVDGFISYVEQLLFEKVNQAREEAGLPPLDYHSDMTEYARMKSKDMGERNYFSHENPEGDLMSAVMQQDGVSYQSWGENIAFMEFEINESFESLAEQLMSNWMNSSGHRANILSTDFSSIGIGVYRVGNKVYATQEFYR